MSEQRTKMEQRWTFSICEPIPELVESLRKLRRKNKNYSPTKSDIVRQAIVIGLRTMIADETTELAEVAKQKEELENARKVRRFR